MRVKQGQEVQYWMTCRQNELIYSGKYSLDDLKSKLESKTINLIKIYEIRTDNKGKISVEEQNIEDFLNSIKEANM